MIVFSAVVPHAPFLVPNIGKDAYEQLKRTVDALHQVEERLVLAKPDTLVIISPHAPRYPDAFSANMSPQFTAHMQDFGDHETTVPARVDYLLLDRVHRGIREAKIPFTLRSSDALDYGYTVPLTYLTPHLTNWNILPIAPSEQPLPQQGLFGEALYHILQGEDARIAVIASADLCHHTTPGSKQQITPETQAYDEQIRAAMRDKKIDHIAQASLAADRRPCGERPIAILLGLLKDLNTTTEELCYEAPFGVGYSTTIFHVA
ncbi:AmmeMemoRadiSam system protein B [Patescibacteria group bacterium]|nr:AmmeMemoRadiSam system protein B [Patescibacteria group bacterium]